MIPTDEQRLSMQARPGGKPVMFQRWSNLLFLHWKIDPSLIQEKLPAGLFVDTFDGGAWIGVVPFYMERVRPVKMPALPLLSWFLELNVRTYVHDGNGNAGVWFFSLDCNQPVAVEIARRLFHLPYEHAAMKAVSKDSRINYYSRRRIPLAAVEEFQYDLPVNPQASPFGSLEWFLVERYLLFSSNRTGRLFSGRVHHEPYQIAPAKCDRWATGLLRLNGFEEPQAAPDSMLVCESVKVSIFPLRAL